MPTYTFQCAKCGKVTDHFVDSHMERTDHIKCACGGKANYDFAKTFSSATFAQAGDKMYWSEALGVRPDEVTQTIAEDRNMGSTADAYRADGCLGFKSWERKRRYERLRGFAEG